MKCPDCGGDLSLLGFGCTTINCPSRRASKCDVCKTYGCICIKPYAGPPELKEERKDTNPKDAAASTRLDLSLVPSTAIAYCALALAEGARKYGAYNWRRKGVLASVYKAAKDRHSSKWWNGQDYDPHTAVHELASVMACCAILIDAIECDKLIDDRPPKAPMGKLLDKAEAVVKGLYALFPNGAKRYTETDKDE